VTDWAIIDTADRPMRMYMARPEGGTAGPGVLVVHDAFGVTDHLQEVCRRFAEEGLVALAPELYHGFATRSVSYDDPAAAEALHGQLGESQLMDDLFAALRFLGARGEVRSGLCGVVGYGAGSRNACLLATRNSDVLALVSYGGALAPDGPSSPVRDSANLVAPVLLFFGESDKAISAEGIQQLRDTLTNAAVDHDIVTYPGVGDGFFCEAQTDRFDADAAADAWTRTVDFIYERLEG